jgi:hypothetical protein
MLTLYLHQIFLHPVHHHRRRRQNLPTTVNSINTQVKEEGNLDQHASSIKMVSNTQTDKMSPFVQAVQLKSVVPEVAQAVESFLLHIQQKFWVLITELLMVLYHRFCHQS